MLSLQRAKRIFPVIVVAVVMGCTLGPQEYATPRSYFLQPVVSWHNPQPLGVAATNATLLITAPKAQAGFDSARMAYLMRPYEVSYFAFNQWADTPARMLQQVMTEQLGKSGQWRAVLQTPGAIKAEYRLDCESLILEQQFFSSPSRIRLALRAQLFDLGKQALVATRDFELYETAPSDDPYGGVVAANRVAATLIRELTAWLEQAVKANQ